MIAPAAQRLSEPDTAMRLVSAILAWSALLLVLVYYLQQNQLHEMFWMCHAAKLVLALALTFYWRRLMLAAALWQIVGLITWLLSLEDAESRHWVSVTGHLLGLAAGIGAIVISRVRQSVWFYAFLWYLGMQVLARLFTPSAANVNRAFAADPYWQNWFGGFFSYWLLTSLVIMLALWLVEYLARKLLYSRKPSQQVRH